MRLCRYLNLKNSIGIYIHIPFCIKKCDYCDFYSVTEHNKQDRYVDYLIKEIDNYKEVLANRVVSSIYFGGGTPSLLTIENVNRIVNKVYEFDILENIEITFEANPETLSIEYLKELHKTKINRLSIGMQSMDNKILGEIGRIHSKEKFIQEYNNARKVGFNNISIDVMFGFYKQSLDDLHNTLKELVALAPTHISCYSLIYEENTKMFARLENGEIDIIDEDLQVEMYDFMKNFLEQNGYNRYEISNFAKSGFESKHNSSYWQNIEYIGVGAAASSYVDNKRYNNKRSIDEYIKNNGINCYENFEELSKDDLISEYFFLGLRQDKGVSIKKFEERFDKNYFDIFGETTDNLIKDGLILMEEDIIRLTEKGVQLSNYVFEKFI